MCENNSHEKSMKKKIGLILMATILLLSLVCIASCGEDEKFKVTFVDWDDRVIEIDEVEPNSAATPPEDPTREGYVFSGWDISFDEVSGDITVKATYTEIPPVVYYAVRFVDWDGTELSKASVESGKAATAPTAPTREGYRFTGWDKDFSKITSDVNIIAKYVKTFTVTFKNDDGTILKTEKVDANGSATAPTATKEGYTFERWDREFEKVVADMVITAVYVEKFDVTFMGLDKDGKDVQIAVVKVDKDKAATAPEVPEREGYRFDKWDKTFSKVTANMTVTAKYIKTWKVEFKGIGNDNKETTISTVTVDDKKAATAPEVPEREGYRFDKWDKTFNKVTEDTIVTAQYVKVWEVTFKGIDNNGKETTIDTVTVDDGKAATPPEVPVRIGYRFDKWDKAFNKVTGNLTVKAEYIQTFNVKFVYKDEKNREVVIATVTVDENNPATAPTPPEREGYNFNKWNKTTEDLEKITSDLTVIAEYTEIEKIKVTFTYKDANNTTVTKDVSVYKGSAATAPTVPSREKDGYRFEWDKTAEELSNITSALTVNGQYVKVWKVTFKGTDNNGNEITIGDEPVTVDNGKAATAPEVPEREGYRFDKWDKTDDELKNITADLTVKAEYVKQFTVKFVNEDGTTVLKEEKVDINGSATPPASDVIPEKPGFVFDKWDGNYTNVQADVTVKATYKEKPAVQSPKLSVTNVEDGEAGKTVTVIVSVENNEKDRLAFDVSCSDPISLTDRILLQSDLKFSKNLPKVTVYSNTATAIDGNMFTLIFQIAEGAAAGNYEFSISGDLSASGTITVTATDPE